jgi:hypothetical protein
MLPESALNRLARTTGDRAFLVAHALTELRVGGLHPHGHAQQLRRLIRDVLELGEAETALLIELERLLPYAVERDRADGELADRRLREAEASGAVVRIDQRRAA